MNVHHLLVLSAALAACAPTAVPAQPRAPELQGPWSVDLVDEAGRLLPTFQHRGRTYVLGTRGGRYLVRVRNESGRRVEVVVSVDGRDVIDGRPASWEKRGYLVDPWGEVAIDGYRLGAESVAAFRFSTVPRSYAALTGDARDVGVIGAAVFLEQQARQVPLPRPAPWYEGEAQEDRSRPAPGSAKGSRADAAPAPSAASEATRDARRPGLGTEFGERHESHVQQVAFERANARPDAVLTVRYDDRPGLLALGIDLDGRRWARRDEAWRRETAEPFRGSPGYAEPPPGWRSR
jgi:hypothetical protein